MSKSRRRQVRTSKPPSQRYDPNKLLYIATHEAGHAVSAVVLGIGLERVDIRRRHLPNGDISVGYTKTVSVPVLDILGKGVVVARPLLVQTMTGLAAESTVNPRVKEIGSHYLDLADCRRIASAAICQSTELGTNIVISPEELRRNAVRIASLVDSAREDAACLVRDHLATIVRVAELLQKHKELTGDEVAKIVRERIITNELDS